MQAVYPTQRRQIRFTVLNAAIVGSTHTAVLRFDAPPVVNSGITPTLPLAEFATVETTAEFGTVVSIRRRGLWHIELMAIVTANDVTLATSYNADPAFLTAATIPVVNNVGVVASGRSASLVAPHHLASVVPVSDSELSGPTAIRFLASEGGEAIGDASLIRVSVRATITYLGDLLGA